MDVPGMTAYLEDSYTNAATALSLTTINKVNFNITSNTASQSPTRFRVVFKMPVVLPVTYTSVKAQQQNKVVAVEWKVENQLNIKQYEVERSADGRNFATVSLIPASVNKTDAYKWLDQDPLKGSNFYRIRNIDLDGTAQYSQVVEVKIGKSTSGFSIYPNPVQNSTIGLQANIPAGGNYQLRLINMAGQVIFTKEISLSAGSNMKAVKVDTQLAPGIYKLEITDPLNQSSIVNVNVN
jgi:hypothetical protein